MKKGIMFSISFASLLFFSYMVLQRQVRRNLRFFWTDGYFYIIYAALVIGLAFIIFRSLKKFYPYLKYFYFFIFLPVAAFPVLRCYFKVPYVFCRACPQQCPWGYLRKAMVPGLLTMNIDKRFWCYRLCPFGTIQDHQSGLCRIRLSLPGWLRNIRFFFLSLTIVMVLLAIFSENSPLIMFFYLNIYHLVPLTIIFSVAIFLFSFFIPRLWCNYFCPIGSFSDLVLKMKRLFIRNNQ